MSLLRILVLVLISGSTFSVATAKAEARAEVPLEAILGDRAEFDAWAGKFRKEYSSWIDDIQQFQPSGSRIVTRTQSPYGVLHTIAFDYQKSSPLHGKVSGGILAIPKHIDATKPLVVAIHGHEHGQWEMYPDGLMVEGQWPLEFLKNGYVVWVPVSMRHSGITSLATMQGYLPIWTKEISQGIDQIVTSKTVQVPHKGIAAVGVSSGGSIAFLLMAYRSDIQVGVFAGAQLPLVFLRQEYRIKNHPDCWDIPKLASYTPIQALIAPRPVQFQLGKEDPGYPNGEPFARQGDWFAGTSRDVLTDEIGGQMLILKSLWKMKGGEVSQHLHAGGHQMDIKAALKFVSSHSGK